MDATRILVCHLTCCGLEGEKIITENQAKENLTNVGWTYFLIELLPTSFLLFLNFSIDRKYNLSMAGFEQHDFRKSAIWNYDTLQDHCGLLGLRHVDREMAIEILID